MRITIPFVCLLASVLFVHAQIPNATFEWWADQGTETPDGWYTENALYGDELVRSTTNSYFTLYAAKLENKDIGGDHVVRAMMVSGVNDLKRGPGFAYSLRPGSLNGYFHYQPKNNDDSCYVIVQLSRFNSFTQTREIIGTGQFSSGDEIDQYTAFTVPISYFSNEDPDTATIIIYAGKYFGAKDGSRLFIDELSFDEASTGVVIIDGDELGLTVSPNPTNNILTIGSTEYNLSKQYSIYDSFGRLITSKTLSGKSIDVSALANGMYHLFLYNASGTVVGKASFMVQN